MIIELGVPVYLTHTLWINLAETYGIAHWNPVSATLAWSLVSSFEDTLEDWLDNPMKLNLGNPVNLITTLWWGLGRDFGGPLQWDRICDALSTSIHTGFQRHLDTQWEYPYDT